MSVAFRSSKRRRRLIEGIVLLRGGGVTPLRAPTPLCQNRVCLTRGVSPGAYRGAQGRSLKNTWKMFVFNCMIHFVNGVIGVSIASLI